MTRTKHPVVLIHGVFGYGRQRPLWSTMAPYWPEQALDELQANYLIVDVGVLASNHDRACEAFFQLYGGRVDYGDAHAAKCGHARYGVTYDTPLHAHWSEDHPVHLLGHSFGGTTALELYQLICCDAFGVGSNHKWVASIISIAGPLSGSTLTHLTGLHGDVVEPFTLAHAVGATLCLWLRLLVEYPVLRRLYEFRMPQWEGVGSYRELLSASKNRILASMDLAVFDIMPARQLKRNLTLTHMDKPFLVSISTSSHTQLPWLELTVALLVMAVAWSSTCIRDTDTTATIGVIRLDMAAYCAVLLGLAFLLKRVRRLDYASLPCFSLLCLPMRRCVRNLHSIFDGFDREVWEENDGAVNLYSMQRPFVPSQLTQIEPTIVAATSDAQGDAMSETLHHLDLDEFTDAHIHASPRLNSVRTNTSNKKNRPLERGRWYTHSLRKNHFAGTQFDADASDLYRKLLLLIAREFEGQVEPQRNGVAVNPKRCTSASRS